MPLYRASLIFALVCAFLLPSSAFAQTAPDEIVKDFRVIATVQPNRTLKVTETIEYDFGIGFKHGIYRTIPVAYHRNGGSYNLHLKLLGISMDNAPIPYSIVERSPNFNIRIGDPDETVSGVHTYVIAYETDRAINFFNGEAELYWNVTGNDWPVTIMNASFSVTGPASFDASAAPRQCFTGVFGSNANNCQMGAQGNAAHFETSWALHSGEGLTAVMRFPKGMIAEPSLWERIWMLIRDNAILFVPFLVFAFMFWRWWNYGREPKGRGTIVPQYEAPRGLAPIEMQALLKQTVSPSAITATIIDLARRGYLKINFGEKTGIFKATQSYSFTRMKANDDTLKSFEATILNGLFFSKATLSTFGALLGSVDDSNRSKSDAESEEGVTVRLDDLKGTFYTTIASVKSQVFSSLRQQGLFGRSPYAVRSG